MKLKEDTYSAILVTTGRKSCKEHPVELKAVYYDGKFYFSRRDANSDWLKNTIAKPLVKVRCNDMTFQGKASLVLDQELVRKISHMKYSDKRAENSRIVLEVTLDE